MDYSLRVWFGLIFAGSQAIFEAPGFDINAYYFWPAMIHVGKNGLAEALWFWLIFDLSLNLLRGKAWNYISMTNGKFFDRIFIRKVSGFFLVNLDTDEASFVKAKDGAHKVSMPNWKLQIGVKLLGIIGAETFVELFKY